MKNILKNFLFLFLGILSSITLKVAWASDIDPKIQAFSQDQTIQSKWNGHPYLNDLRNVGTLKASDPGMPYMQCYASSDWQFSIFNAWCKNSFKCDEIKNSPFTMTSTGSLGLAIGVSFWSDYSCSVTYSNSGSSCSATSLNCTTSTMFYFSTNQGDTEKQDYMYVNSALDDFNVAKVIATPANNSITLIYQYSKPVPQLSVKNTDDLSLTKDRLVRIAALTECDDILDSQYSVGNRTSTTDLQYKISLLNYSAPSFDQTNLIPVPVDRKFSKIETQSVCENFAFYAYATDYKVHSEIKVPTFQEIE